MKQLLLLIVFIMLFSAVHSQTPERSAEVAPVLNHIAVYVKDLKKSTAFYQDVLGLKQMPEPFHDGLHTWFTLGNAGQLHLIQGAGAEGVRNKNEHLCFSVPSVERFIARLNSFKVEYTNWPGNAKAPTVRVDGVKQIYFQDPDGHWLEINDDQVK